MSYPMPMNMIQQLLMGAPRTPSEPSSNEDSFQFDQPVQLLCRSCEPYTIQLLDKAQGAGVLHSRVGQSKKH